MIDQAPIILLSVLVAGAVLVWLGWRGRRVNDHPVCRRCRFDLYGVYPGGATCPECGADLKAGRAVRDGVRVRRRLPFALGIVVLVFCGAIMGAVVWLMAAGPSMNKHKPALVLALEGRYAGTKASRAAAVELIERMRRDELSEGDINWSVKAALAIQGELDRKWVKEWGDVIEEAQALQKVSDNDYTRYLRQSVVLECVVRPEVIAGERLPLVVGVAEWRRANAPAFDVGVWVDSVKIGGREVEWGYHGERRLAMGNSEGPLRIASTAKVSWGPATKPVGADTLGLEFDVPVTTSAGACGVEVEVRVSREAGAQAASKDTTLETRVASVLRRETRLIAEETTHVMAVGDVNDSLRKLLSATTAELTVATWGGEEDEPTWRATVIVPRASSPVPFAYDVVIVIGDREYLAGTVVSGQMPRRGRLGVTPGGKIVDPETEVMLVADIPADEASEASEQECRVEFRPRGDLAALTLDMTWVFEETIVLEKVRLERVTHVPTPIRTTVPRTGP